MKYFLKVFTSVLLLSTSLLSNPEKVSLKLQWLNQFQFAGYYIAKEKGFYKDVDLQVDIKSFKMGDDPVKEVLSGKAQYGTGRTSLIIDKSEGKNLFLMASIFQSSPMVLVSKKSSGINNIKDFYGKSIMLTGTETSAGIFGMTSSKGIHASNMRIVKSKNKIENLINDNVDIISGYTTNQVYILKKRGIDINVFNPKDYGFDFYGDILFTNEDEAINHRDRAIKFKQASLRGWRYAFSHINEAVEIILAKYNTQNRTKEDLTYEANELKKLAYYKINNIGQITKEKIQRIYDIYRIMGFINKPLDINNIILSTDKNRLYLTQKEKKWIKKHPIVTYSEVNWKPLSIIKDSKMTGVFGDVLDLVSKKSGITFKFVPSNSWSHVIEQFKNKKIDMIPSNPQIFDLGLISDSYKKYPMVIITGKNYKYIDSLDSLSGKTIVVPNFYTSFNYIITNYPDIKIIVTKDIPEALRILDQGKADAFVGHIATSLYYISDLFLSDLKVAGTAKFQYSHNYLIQKELPELLSIINKSFKLITEKEKIQVYSNWTNTVIEKNMDYKLIWQILLVVSLLFLLLQYRNHRLNKHNKEIHKLKERLELALIGNSDGVWDRDFVNDTLYLSDRWKEMIGYKNEELKTKSDTWEILVHSDDFENVKRDLQNHLEGKTKSYENIHRLKHKNGHWIWVLDRGQRILSKDGKVIRMLGTQTDITKRKELEIELKKQKEVLSYQANYDSLTNLPNRTLFNDRLAQSIEKSKRNNDKFALFFLDLDMFKQINDSLGHEIGDKVLVKVGNRIRKVLRKEDTLARLGGDEFTVITEQLTKVEDAGILACKILAILKKPITVNEHSLYVSISIGISLFPNDSKNADSLLKYADSAMYKAKDEGRDNYQFYSREMTEKVFERVVLETSLRLAIKNEEFVVYYQPQINSKNNKLIGMEALVRWQHPTMGLVSPMKFIPLAEDTGMIVDIDRLVMKKAMNQVSAWYGKGLKPGILSLNLSKIQLNGKNFMQVVQDSMTECNFKAQWLELEVTESKVMQKPEEMIQKLKQLSNMGIKIAIDDFGTGYSSLSYLKRLPINTLKIDQSFVRDIPNDDEDVAIVKAIIALAKSLNLSLIGEGVETTEQKDFLLENGCEKIQGYFYSKPIPADEFKNKFLA